MKSRWAVTEMRKTAISRSFSSKPFRNNLHADSTTLKTTTVALLHQAAPPPAIGNTRKPMKPGGQSAFRQSAASTVMSGADGNMEEDSVVDGPMGLLNVVRARGQTGSAGVADVMPCLILYGTRSCTMFSQHVKTIESADKQPRKLEEWYLRGCSWSSEVYRCISILGAGHTR
jgi:hypothetical protein